MDQFLMKTEIQNNFLKKKYSVKRLQYTVRSFITDAVLLMKRRNILT